MPFHMLAVFDHETARAPAGLEPWTSSPTHAGLPSEQDLKLSEEICKLTLEKAYSVSKPDTRKMELFGKGNGFAFEATPFCSYAERNGVHVLFAGEVSRWPGIDTVSANHNAFLRDEPPLERSDAHWLLDFYESFMDYIAPDLAESALECLSDVVGTFGFVIYDETQRRVLAARDAQGAQPLYWGANEEGQLMVGSNLSDLANCNPSAVEFPAGTLFASEPHTLAYSPGDQGWIISSDEWPGQIMSFVKEDAVKWKGVKAIPRITSKGVLCGAIYKVASKPSLVSH